MSELAQAQQLIAAQQHAQAQVLLHAALADPANRAEAHYLLAVSALMSGHTAEALAQARNALSANPHDARSHVALGRAHKAAGALAAAVAAYRKAIALQPSYAEAHVSLGITLKLMGALDEALQCQELALSLQPKLAVAQANLAIVKAALAERNATVSMHQGVDPHGLAAALHVVTLAPDNAAAHFNHGLLLLQAGSRAEAIRAFDRALGLAPGDLGYCLRLGQELEASGAAHQAAVLYENWLNANRSIAPVMRALANVLVTQGLSGAAIDWSERAAALDPGPLSWLALCNAYQQGRRMDRALAAGRQAIEHSGKQWQFYSMPLMVSNYLLEQPQAIADLHADFGRAIAAALPAQSARPNWHTKAAGQPLRVGYVSPDFVNHSVAYFLGSILEHHDRSRFEVHCFHNRHRSDSMTERLQSFGHRWTSCAHWSDEALCERIRCEGIDILVDLAGHTAGERLRLFALAPAPVQVAYLGYPTWSGVPSIGHRITDATIDAGDMPDIGSERPLLLPGSMFCYRAPEEPAIAPPPSQQKGFVTFGSFNNLAKLSDHCLSLWARVLRAVPTSKLLIKAASVADAANRDNLQRFMAAEGIAADRLVLHPQTEARASHLALYNEIDVALDTFPYNGATTTCEALWMGVPVVTRHGATHTARIGASLLGAAGKGEWITYSDDAYVATAKQLAGDVTARAHWRLQARQILRASPLMDEAGFVRSFEAALLQAWDQRQSAPS